VRDWLLDFAWASSTAVLTCDRLANSLQSAIQALCPEGTQWKQGLAQRDSTPSFSWRRKVSGWLSRGIRRRWSPAQTPLDQLVFPLLECVRVFSTKGPRNRAAISIHNMPVHQVGPSARVGLMAESGRSAAPERILELPMRDRTNLISNVTGGGAPDSRSGFQE
jgi:hypothetical protein